MAEASSSAGHLWASRSSLSPTVIALLNHHFKSTSDLANAPSLLVGLSSDLHASQERLSHLHSSIAATLASWASLSLRTSSSLSSLSEKLRSFSPETPPVVPALDTAAQEDLVGQLPALATEVAFVERVRLYAETALRLEARVGDLEDAVASIIVGVPQFQLPRKMANSPSADVLFDLSSRLSSAANAVQKVEDVIVETPSSWPQWKRLLIAVDIRVDNALASLKPAALADYRSKLQTIGWPPPLTTGNQEGERNTKLDNPLLRLQGNIKRSFEESFVSLSILQSLQHRRRTRQALRDSQATPELVGECLERELLWTLDELVAPIKSRATYHFQKWSDKPDLIFGLAYCLAQQHTDVVDMILQPMLDKAQIAGYSVREEWISALVTMVIHHLRNNTLAELAAKLVDEEHKQEAASLWLYIVDLANAFDKRMRSIAMQSIVSSASNLESDSFEESVDELHPIVRCLGVFAEQKEWLELWANLELSDAQEKLGNELKDKSVWLVAGQSRPTVSSSVPQSDSLLEGYNHPQSAEICMLKMWALLNRCRSLPQRSQRLMYVLHVGAPYMNAFLSRMLQKCQEAEAMTALAEDNAVSVVVSCVNAACFCEHKLQEWGEVIFFLDLRRLQVSLAIGESDVGSLGLAESEHMMSPVQGCVFDREISSLLQFRNEWLQKLVTATQRALDASCQDYQRNKRHWQEDSRASGSAAEMTLSPGLVDGLAILQRRLAMLKNSLENAAFMDFWRGLASSLDQFFMHSVILGGAKFSSVGCAQLSKDMRSLFQIFKPFCIRPASFFPNLSDTVQLLALPAEDAQQLHKALSHSSSWRLQDNGDESKLTSLRLCGIRNLPPAVAGRVLAQRLFSKV